MVPAETPPQDCQGVHIPNGSTHVPASALVDLTGPQAIQLTVSTRPSNRTELTYGASLRVMPSYIALFDLLTK